MTPEHRAAILETKHQLSTDEARTPMFTGIYIHKAVIDDGVHQLDGIVRVFRSNGIDV